VRKVVVVIQPDKIRAFVFDLDGVLTDTEKLHVAAWKRMFDEFLRKRAKDDGSFRQFQRSDYLKYVDGKPRYDGARDFLESRHVSIPYGSEQDPSDKETVCGLANRKNDYYRELLDEEGAEVFKTSVAFIKAIRARGLKTAIISSSKNCAKILRVTGTESLFDARVDGVDLESLGIPGKPDPAMFLEAARRIKVKPREAAVVEDALAGVEAGAHGRFGLVVGVARSRNARGLKKHGARVVVTDLKELKLADEEEEEKKKKTKKRRHNKSSEKARKKKSGK
jgi:trehalose 6-phosphate phosphatase